MRNLVRALNGYFIAGVLAVFYVFAVGLSFLMVKIRNAVKGKSRKGWVKSSPLEKDFTSSY